jgi:hypothetical protein
MARPQCDTPLVYFWGGEGRRENLRVVFFFLQILSFFEKKNWEIAEN